MSFNQSHSSNPHETHWWLQPISAANTSAFSTKAAAGDTSPAADNGGTSMEDETKEPLFEKPLTPSDVGKLNRLVIPKQHAENYFPLHSGGGGGGESGEKGSLLSFEDEVGKSWRFRYSYWSSSQSYVLTKGWSRFVKEKGLDAGDVVVFTRRRGEGGRFFIGWRRRNNCFELQERSNFQPPSGGGGGGGGGGWVRRVYSDGYPYRRQHEVSSSPPYQHECRHAIAGSIIERQAKTATAGGNLKKLRLFGVNLEWEAGSDN